MISFLHRDPEILPRLIQAVERTLDVSGKPLVQDRIALAFGTLEGSGIRFGSVNGSLPFYPASVVKLFYLACLQSEVAEKKIALTAELERARRDMIVDSNNDATALVLDTLTNSTGGPELPPKELAVWMKKRQGVNRWLSVKGINDVNLCQKPWNEGPYGRERQGYGKDGVLANRLNADASLTMMAGISLGAWHKTADQKIMFDLLRREPGDPKDAQASDFIGGVLPKGWRLWSKAGWTSKVRNDVALIESPAGKRHVLVVLTRGYSEDVTLVPRLARAALRACLPSDFRD
ncbi:MAG: serine hydrolase [Armatimonadota bacterium]